MSKRELLKLPDDLEGNLRALLNAPPPPHDVKGSRKAAPKPVKAKAKAPKRKSPPKASATDAAIQAQARYKAEQLAASVKRKATKKR